MLQTIPGVAFGNNFVSAEQGARSLYYQGAGATGGLLGGMAINGGGTARAAVGAAGVLFGTVTDPGGAPVTNARVEIRNVSTGESRAAVSNSDGVFRFNGLPTGRYNLAVAGAAGFKTYTLNGVEVAANEARSVGSIALSVGSVTDAVSVTAAAAPVQIVSGEGGRRAAPSASRGGAGGAGGPAPPAAAGRDPGVRYQVLRLARNGNFEAVDDLSSLTAGDSIRLQFVPNVPGYLYVSEPGASAQLLRTRVEGAATAATAPIRISTPGRRTFWALFSRTELPSRQTTAEAISQLNPAATDIKTETVAAERTTYVVNTNGAASSVPFSILLDFK